MRNILVVLGVQFEMSDIRRDWLLKNSVIEPIPNQEGEYQLVDGPQREVAMNLLYIEYEEEF